MLKCCLPILFLLTGCAAMPAVFQSVDDAVDTLAKEEQSLKIELDKEMLQKDVNYQVNVTVSGASVAPASSSPTSTK